MKVFKFGGASIETIERAKKVAEIISDYHNESLIVVISAKGKTTNFLENIVQNYFIQKTDIAFSLFEDLKKEHFEYANNLLDKKNTQLENHLNELFIEVEWILNEPPTRTFDYYYDQIVSIGELLSTRILSAYFKQCRLNNFWIDSRDIFKTDSNYRDAQVDWQLTERNIQTKLEPLLKTKRLIVLQGFIGSTDENNSVTLGREGSDYTAAIVANLCNAESVTIWKDVPSLLNADPKIFSGTVPIPEITFHEVIEMAYYGAQVIHPKTIKPLQNKNIPLWVKCFLDKNLVGTKIYNTDKKIKYPPIYVLKSKQTLLQVNTRDYSFITEENLSKIYSIFHQCKIKINLIQNAAISFVACIDSNTNYLDELLQLLNKDYVVKLNDDLFLFTVRHYKQNLIRKELENRTILLTQKTRQTIQMVVK